MVFLVEAFFSQIDKLEIHQKGKGRGDFFKETFCFFLTKKQKYKKGIFKKQVETSFKIAVNCSGFKSKVVVFSFAYFTLDAVYKVKAVLIMILNRTTKSRHFAFNS